MQVTLNSQPTDLPDGSSVLHLLATLQLPSTRVAVEVNRSIVRRADHSLTFLCQGDVIEVVTLVGGG